MKKHLWKKKLMSALLAVLMLCTMLPVNVSAFTTTPTDYLYGNSQNVANSEIKIPVTGGTVTLYIKLPAETYNSGTSGAFGFDLTQIPDTFTCTQEYTTCKADLDKVSPGWDYNPTPWGFDSEGNSELTNQDKRKAFIVVYENSSSSTITLSGDTVLAAMEVKVPSGLTAGDTYSIGVTSQRCLYDDNTPVFDIEKGIAGEWKITITDTSTISASNFAIETNTTLDFDTVNTRAKLSGTTQEGTTKVFSESDLDSTQWTALKSAADAGKIGDYSLKITSGTASKTITVTLADEVVWTETCYIYANNFAYQNGSTVSASQVKTAANAKAFLNDTETTVTVDATNLDAFSQASANKETGAKELTFSANSGAVSVTVHGTLYDHVVSEDSVVLAANDFSVMEKSKTSAEMTNEWFCTQSSAFASTDGVAGTAGVDSTSYTAFKTTVVTGVDEDTDKTVQLQYGGKTLNVTATVLDKDESTISAESFMAEVGSDAISTPSNFAVSAKASGKDKHGNTITTWTEANFEGYAEVQGAPAGGSLKKNDYPVRVKATTGSAYKDITVTLHSEIDEPEGKGKIWADNRTLQTGDTSYTTEKLKTDCRVGALKADNKTADTNITVIDTNGVVAAMKASETGSYNVTFKNSLDATVTVTVTLYDKVVPDSDSRVLSANNFRIGTGANTTEPKGNLTGKNVIDLSSAKLVKGNGVLISLLNGDALASGVTITGLDALNTAKNDGKTGPYSLTISYNDPADPADETISVTITVTLDSTRYKFDYDNDNFVNSKDGSVMLSLIAGTKVSTNDAQKTAWLLVMDSNGDGKFRTNDYKNILSVINGKVAKTYIRVPNEYEKLF